MSQPAEPTSDQLRAARQLGAATSLSHLPEESRSKLVSVHAQLDARREKNIREFTEKARGSARS